MPGIAAPAGGTVGVGGDPADRAILSFASRPGAALRATRAGNAVRVEGQGRSHAFCFDGAEGGRPARLAPVFPLGGANGDGEAVFAALELLFGAERDLSSLRLEGPNWQAQLPHLVREGLAVAGADDAPHALADMVWQHPAGWMTAGTHGAYPATPAETGGRAHPRRPPMPSGTLYARFIPWLGGTLRFDVATPRDLPLLHRWLNDPRVDRFWREAGDLGRHRRYLENQIADPHTMPLIGRFENRPFSYFEVYWATESLIGPFYEAGDHDRGWHVVVGEEDCRGRNWISAWLPSLMHMIFLDDPRTTRIVGEPQADHERQIRNLLKSGFEHFDTVDLPTKRAALVCLPRRRFFANRLWLPAGTDRPDLFPCGEAPAPDAPAITPAAPAPDRR